MLFLNNKLAPHVLKQVVKLSCFFQLLLLRQVTRSFRWRTFVSCDVRDGSLRRIPASPFHWRCHDGHRERNVTASQSRKKNSGSFFTLFWCLRFKNTPKSRPSVIYFDKQISASHAVRWLKSSFSAFLQLFSSQMVKKKERCYIHIKS